MEIPLLEILANGKLKMRRILPKPLILANLLIAALLFAAPPEGAFAGEGGHDTKRITPTAKKDKATKQKTSKKKKSRTKKKISLRWNEIIAQTVFEHFKGDKLGYYFRRKSRMRRLLERMYKEYKETPKLRKDQKVHHTAIQSAIRTIKQKSELGSVEESNLRKIAEAWRWYLNYKNGTFTKAKYEKNMKNTLGFVP